MCNCDKDIKQSDLFKQLVASQKPLTTQEIEKEAPNQGFKEEEEVVDLRMGTSHHRKKKE